MGRGVSSSPSNAGIPQAFDEVVGQREGGVPCCLSLSITPRCMSNVSRDSCMVVVCLCYASISTQSDLNLSSIFMIGCRCGGDGDMLEELGEQGAVCAESESLLSMEKHVILWRIVTALSSALLRRFIYYNGTLRLRRSLRLEGGIQSI